MRRILLVLALVAGTAGCGDDDGHDVPPDAPGVTPDAPLQPDGLPGGCNGAFSAFVIDLVQNQTREDNAPTAIDDCSFTDAEDPAAFDPLF